MKKLFVILMVIVGNLAFSQTGWFLQTSPISKNLTDIYFVNSQTGWACGDSGRVLKTTNSGMNWAQISTPTNFALRAIRFYDINNGFTVGGDIINYPFCLDHAVILKTTNGGDNWSLLNNVVGNQVFHEIAALGKDTSFISSAGSDINCMAADGRLNTTFNSGNNWNTFGSGWVKGISFINSTTGWITIYNFGDASMGLFGVYKTTNTGVNWNRIYSDTAFGSSAIGKIRFVDSNNGYCLYRMLRKTTNGGVNWVKIDSTTTYNIRSFAPINNDTLWIIQNSGIVKRTNNSGVNWSQQLSASVVLNSIYFIDKNTGWIAGNNGIIYKTTTGGVTGIQNVSSEIPSSYSLSQNYPNPFNPSTKIRFAVPNDNRTTNNVKLIIYDVTGREVQALVNEKLPAGTYETTFDGSGLTSGVYFYRLQTDSYSETKRMFLIK